MTTQVNNNQIIKPDQLYEQLTGDLNKPQSEGFDNAFHKALSSVNEAQQNASSLKQRYQLGDKSVSVADVMLATQKSRIEFQGLLKVRNELIKSYNEILNMNL